MPFRHFPRVFAASLLLLPLTVQSADTPAPPDQAAAVAAPDADKAVYAIGVLLARNLQSFALSPAEIARVQAGIADESSGKATVDLEGAMPLIQALEKERRPMVLARQKEQGKAYQDKAAAETGATRTRSGIVMTTVKAGTGASPSATDNVKVHYEGRLIDGTVFDSSIRRNEPATFPLNGVVPCWTEAVQQMKVGGNARIVCPSDLAYGDRGSPPRIPGGATLVFDIQLLDILKP